MYFEWLYARPCPINLIFRMAVARPRLLYGFGAILKHSPRAKLSVSAASKKRSILSQGPFRRGVPPSTQNRTSHPHVLGTGLTRDITGTY